MSKYIKLEDAIEAYNQAVTLLVESEMEEFNLGDFTECSFNTTQIKLIARMIESLPTIEISEDCISREWVKGICENMLDEEMLGHMLGYIEDAPSVVPKTQMETQNSNLTFEKRTMRDCYNCKRYEAEGECIECHYEPKDEPTCDTCRHKGVEGCEQPCLGCGRCGLYEAMTENDKFVESASMSKGRGVE